MEKLYKKNKNSSIQQWQIEVFDEEIPRILVTQGQLDGKKQEYPELVPKGKQKRSALEQAQSQAQSTWRGKLDEGYKTLSSLGIVSAEHIRADFYSAANGTFNDTLKECLQFTLPNDATDANGLLKPMKCTPIEEGVYVNNKGVEICKVNFPAFVQPKLDGVKMFVKKDEDQYSATSSGGKSYKYAAAFILAEFEKLDLDFSLFDGELYIHGVDLQDISGWARTEYYIPEQELLEYHIYDMPSDLPQVERLVMMESVLGNLPVDSKIKLVPYDKLESISDLKSLHDKWVNLGYEGIIVRNSESKYLYGKRSREVFKMKNFQDAEFEIVGAILGKRGTEDMVFILKNSNGVEFNCKPRGDRKKKIAFWDNIEQLKGQLATVTFLTYSKDGIPQGNPVMKAIRGYGE